MHAVSFDLADFPSGRPAMTFMCQAEDGAHCRVMCPRDECAEGCSHVGEPGHEPVDAGQCLFVEWMENSDAEELIREGYKVTLPVKYEMVGSEEGPEWWVDQEREGWDEGWWG